MLYDLHELRDGSIIICPECRGYKELKFFNGRKQTTERCKLCESGLVQINLTPVENAKNCNKVHIV